MCITGLFGESEAFLDKQFAKASSPFCRHEIHFYQFTSGRREASRGKDACAPGNPAMGQCGIIMATGGLEYFKKMVGGRVEINGTGSCRTEFHQRVAYDGGQVFVVDGLYRSDQDVFHPPKLRIGPKYQFNQLSKAMKLYKRAMETIRRPMKGMSEFFIYGVAGLCTKVMTKLYFDNGGRREKIMDRDKNILSQNGWIPIYSVLKLFIGLTIAAFTDS
jgi:hypothetical protein